ncbi:T9SS type A sorting domain-containing protein [Flavobacterium magnum]|nr:T9SS type A sorting domain-containing protein [Flavobacterium magnum]
MKNKSFFTVLFAIGSLTLQAQTISKSVINSFGGTQSSSSVKLTSNVGEIITGLTGSEASGQLSSGFLPALDMSALSIEDQSVTAVLVYPNPTTDKLFIANKNALELSVTIYSETGQLLRSAKTNETQSGVDVSDFSKGIYIVNIALPGNKNNAYKIIKN